MNFQIFSSAKIIGGSEIAQIVKYLGYHRKNNCGDKLQINITHITTIIAENTENLLNSVSYTIEVIKLKIVRKSHLLLCKIGIFSSATAIVSTNRYKLLLHKNIKAAIDCSYIYCEGRYGKVLQTHVFLFKCTIVFIGVINLIDSIVQNINLINSTQNIIATKT